MHSIRPVDTNGRVVSEAQQRVLDSLGCTVAVIDDPTDPDKGVPVTAVHKVLVVGGGLAGTAAAIAQPARCQ